MRNTRLIKNKYFAVGLSLLLLALFAPVSMAKVTGSLKTRSGAVFTGTIRYKKMSRVYVIDYIQNRTPLSSEIKASDVLAKRINKPAALDAAIKKADGGQHTSAIPILEKIVSEYETLEWDIPAGKSLGECYIAKGKINEAITMCQKVYKNNVGEELGLFMRVYWKALLAGKRNTELGKLLDEAAASGDRESAAIAQVMRGDMAMKAGRYEDAVIDGYLRTVLLFQDIKSVRPEAIYKTYKCFMELGRQQYAEKMRNRLMREFPGNKWTQKLNAG